MTHRIQSPDALKECVCDLVGKCGKLIHDLGIGPSETTYQSSHSKDPFTGHTYKSTRMRPFHTDSTEGKQLTSRELIHRGTYPESNFHKDTTYYSSPRALSRAQAETGYEDKAFCQLPAREASMNQTRFLPSVSEPRDFPSQLEHQTHSQMLSEGNRPLLHPHSIQRALPKYLSPNNGYSRLSMVDWIKTAKQKNVLVDDMYLKTGKYSEDSVALRKPILQVAPIRPFSLPPNRYPSFTSIREATSQQRSGGSRAQIPQMNYAKSLSRNAAPTPPPTNKPPTARYPETISSPLNRSSQYGNGMLQSKTRFHEGPRATVDVSGISEMQFNERPQYEQRSSKPTYKEPTRFAIDTQLTETQLSFQNPSEPRKLLLGLPNEHTDKFVKWYKGPSKQEEQSQVAPTNKSSSVAPPKLNSRKPLQPSDFAVLDYQRRPHSTEILDKIQTCPSSHGQPRLETASSRSPHNPSQASYSNEKYNIKGSRQRPTMKSVSVEAKPNERVGENGRQRLLEEMQKRKFPQPPTKGRQYLTSLIRDEQNRVNCEDYNPQRDLPYWFTHSELILLNDNTRTPGQLPPQQQRMIEPWERDSISFSNAQISNFTEGSVMSDPLPLSNQSKNQPANSRIMSMQALPSSLCRDIDIGIQNGSLPPPLRRSMDTSNVPKQNPQYVRPWCHLGSGGDSGYVLQAPALRRRLDRSFNKDPMVRMMTAINPMVTAPSNNGDCNTVIVPTKVLLFCKKGILTLPSPYDLPTVNSFCQPKDLITFNKDLPPNSMGYRRARFSINLDGFLDEDIYFFTDKEGRRLIVEGRRPKRENANARRLVETIDLPPGLQPENLKVARDYKGILHFEEAWIF